jgi:sulfur-carrier protein
MQTFVHNSLMEKQITVLAFGPVTDIIGHNSVVMNDVITTADLIQRLEETYPALKRANYVLALNKKIITQPEKLENGAVVALLPPFSGG